MSRSTRPGVVASRPGWWTLPDTTPRSTPAFDVHEAGSRTPVLELPAVPEHALDGLLVEHLAVWRPALPPTMPERFEDVPGQYAELLADLDGHGRANGADALRLLGWLRHPLVDGFPVGPADHAGTPWWSAPASETWRRVDDALDRASDGAWRRGLAALDDAEARAWGALEAVDRAVQGAIPWPDHLELVQFEGAKRWGPLVAHAPLIRQDLVTALGGPERLAEWGASIAPVRALGRTRDPHREFSLLVVPALVDDVPVPTAGTLLCRTGFHHGLLASGSVVESLRAHAPTSWEPRPWDDGVPGDGEELLG